MPICSFRDLRDNRRIAAANGTGTAAMLGRVEGGSAEQIEVAGSYCEACQRRVGFRISVDEVVVAEGEKI